MTPGEHACDQLKVSLKEYFDSRLAEIERRLVSLNDLNKLMSTERGVFVTRDLHDHLVDDISKLQVRIASLETRMITWVGGMAAFNTLVIMIFVYHITKLPG